MTVFYEPSGAGPAPAPPPVTIITGPTGPAGPQGPAGATGASGAAGTAGASGATGATGTDGAAGATGATGATGAAGATGATGAAGTGGTSAPQSITLFASVASTTFANQSLCTFAFDPSVYTSPTFTLRAILEASSAGPTAQLQLFNLSTGSVVCTLSTSAVIQTLLTHVLTVPSDLPNASQLYCLLLTRSGGVSSQPVICTWASMGVHF